MNGTVRSILGLVALIAVACVLALVFGRLAVAVMAMLVAFVYALSRVFGDRVKRTLENWSGDGVCEDLEPGEAGVLIYALPGAICAATLLTLETQGRLRVVSEVPLELEWLGPPPSTPLEEAVYGATGEEDYAEVLQVLYRQTNDRMMTYSAKATGLYYRKFVRSLWGDDLDENVGRRGLEAWMVLRDAGRDWDRLGDDEAAQRVKRAVRISGRLETKLFSDAFLAKTWAGGPEGFFRFRDDQAPDIRKVDADFANTILLTSWLGYGPMDSGSDSTFDESDT